MEEEILNNSPKDEIDIDKFEWYYLDKNDNDSTKGPLSLRDLDVFLRTNTLDSHTYVWKEGLTEWKKIYQIDDLKELINNTSTEVMESIMRNKIQTSLSQKLENNNQQNYYLGSDGWWHVFNPITKSWHKQENNPRQKKKIETEEEDQENKKEGTEKEEGKKEENSEKKDDKPEAKNTDDSNLKKKRKMGENLKKILTDDQIKDYQKIKKKREKMKDKKKQKWYNAKVNSSIYITGLPSDITEEEIAIYFSKCGLIRKDTNTANYRIKLYKDSQNRNKGDSTVFFLREESVTLAIELFNDTEIKPGYKIKVEPAKFEQKGDYKKREAIKMDELERFKLETEKERLLGWNEEDDEKGLKIVIFKNMFTPDELIEDEGLRNDLELDIIEECGLNFGKIDKYQIYDEHPDGIIKIKFVCPTSAEKCVNAMNHRFYNGKQIECFYWDGKTDYKKYRENKEIEEKRIEGFGKWLEESNDNPDE